ncbi:hypothetical protein T07_9758 [Trichinella nelsoni]|uniref:Uncharacterized protein n=1 Tax=Trichinella nelsoni TaxID=6336 RepID=A0A0V0SAV7_9BILA|nr:hypothetical protein T07_9758 [Trichinella nelsoni]
MSGYKYEPRINRTHFKKQQAASVVISSGNLRCRIGGGPCSYLLINTVQFTCLLNATMLPGKRGTEPNGEYDRADEPAGRHRPISPRCDCDNSPVGLTNELARESGSLQLELLLTLLSPDYPDDMGTSRKLSTFCIIIRNENQQSLDSVPCRTGAKDSSEEEDQNVSGKIVVA